MLNVSHTRRHQPLDGMQSTKCVSNGNRFERHMMTLRMSQDAQQGENTFCAKGGFKDVFLKGGKQYVVALCGSYEAFLHVFVGYSFL